MEFQTVAASYSPLERLPLLALELICEYLSHTDSRRRSLFAFSQASKSCCAAANRERFERILLDAEDQQQIEHALARWSYILTVDDRTRHVRRVKIIGSMMIGADEPELGWSEYHIDFRRGELEEQADENGEDILGREDAFSRPKQFGGFCGSEPKCTEQNKARCNEAWGPVAGFIPKFPGLKQLIWASTDQIPRCILDTLHGSLPKTRLHVHTFSLRSLYQKLDQLHDIDPDEYALASSPNLSSICAPSTTFDTNGNLDYNEEAVQHMTAGIAPNLRSVTMYIQSAGNSPYLLAAIESGRPPWRGFFAGKEGVTQKSQSSLERLAFNGTYHERLSTWAAYTDFSKLRSLDLRTIVHAEYLQELTEMAEQSIFANLQTLSIRLGYDNEEIEENEPLTRWSTRFFSALPHLNGLHVQNPMIRATTTAVLARHGASLKKLHLGNISSLEEVQEIHNACPNLQNLHVGVRRSAGDEREVSTYKALGSLPWLETLSLDLHYTFDLTEEEESDKEKVAQQMRSELTNAAIDAELAQAIFRVIFAANRATRQGILPPFQHLTMKGVGHHYWEVAFSKLTDWLAHSWSCERERADAESEDVLVRELRVEKRRKKDLEASLDEYMKDNFKWCRDGELVRPAWEAVWPESKGKSDWIQIWHSVPLFHES